MHLGRPLGSATANVLIHWLEGVDLPTLHHPTEIRMVPFKVVLFNNKIMAMFSLTNVNSLASLNISCKLWSTAVNCNVF